MVLSAFLYNRLLKIYQLLSAGKRLDPQNDTILVLGGSTTSFGRALCEILVKGYKCKVLNLDKKDSLTQLPFTNYKFIKCHFTNRNSVLNALSRLKELEEDITVIINNVQEGITSLYSTKVPLDPITAFERCAYANLINPIIVFNYYLRELVDKRRRNGRYIINISSELTKHDVGVGMYYVSSKAGLNQFHDGFNSELQVCNELNSFKCLLVYLPYVKEFSRWEHMSSDLANDLVEAMLFGKLGEVTLCEDYSNFRSGGLYSETIFKILTVLRDWK
ncbi:hypothetical protein KAFR_0F02890 [Kazachstania africana CBS 2517]|uniref:Uncharacterized protein n=1 Tax=Kazachstania africana (strain ATCC 22294 / BCRC 22015 / CBS 2517 / CECT 1963 / NBRC 1671 / NRRL Y-8276) TaxID=1071382 RepID=H2AWY5_KAZAF|nr:hypothetical protein KAFR_0F02890 [Kazachstania africana CBS 2517]CCF58885.1 hypothetical protein KAFR_0F02890 [Kazachstania africana CBS 2517]